MARRRFASSSSPKRSRLRDQIRLNRRRLIHESLERRELLAGPELLAIRPDASALLQQNDTLNVAPREFNLLFTGGADIDESTIDNNRIRLVRSGGDGTFGDGNEVNVKLGFVGFVDPGDTDPANLQRIVLRPASSAAHNATDPAFSFPDDTYQIQIIGAGSSPLMNQAGEAFNGGVDFSQTFRLDRGGQVVATVPQPVSRNTQRLERISSPSAGTFTLSFKGATTTAIDWDADASVVQAALEALETSDTTPRPLIRPGDINVVGVASGWEVTFQGHYAGEQVPLLSVDSSGLNQGEVSVARTGALTQASNQIVVYLDDQLLDVDAATDPQYFRLVNTKATLSTSDDQTLLPELVAYDPDGNSIVLTFADAIPEGNYRLDVGQSDGDDGAPTTAIKVGTLFTGNSFSYNGFLGDVGGRHDDDSDVDLFEVQLVPGSTISFSVTPHDPANAFNAVLRKASGGSPNGTELAAGGTFYVEVTSASGTGSYSLNVSVTGNPISVNDDNTTVGDATDLGVLGAAGLSLTSLISRQNIPLPPYPGGLDEPGHRQIQSEAHIGSTGTTPTLPSSLRTVVYHFPAVLGTDPFGDPYQNLITEEEKQIVRSIFEIYASVSGYEFVESENSGKIIGKGDLRAFDPGLGPNSGVAGLGGGAGALLNGTLYDQADRQFGDGFTGVMFHEIGHMIGLGHSYDLPSVQGTGTPNDVLPGDHDVVHLQRIATPNSTDIDLHRFEVTEQGRFTAETIAERYSDNGLQSSLLDTALKLYRQMPNGDVQLVASNDNYFGNDSFIDIELEPGTYFIGVSSTGNTNYDPRVKDSGFGGTTEGSYDLKLNFAAHRDGILRDTDGTAFDGDADGVSGGIYQFWFQASDSTIFVDKVNDTTANVVNGNGSLADPYDTIDYALRQAGNRIVVPVDAVSSIADSDQFTINDGTTTATFEFNKGGGLSQAGVHEINIAAATSPQQIVTAIENAIETALPSVTVTVSDRVVQLENIDNLDVTDTPSLLDVPNLVRIVGNAGADQDLGTLADNKPYLIGLDGNGDPLADGSEFLVPQGVTAMVAAGTLFKMRRANLDAGTSSANISRSHGALQLLGTPHDAVALRSYHNDAVGGNSDGVGPAPRAGDFGGIVFRDDSDMESQGVFLNYVNHVGINNGGGEVTVGSQDLVFAPIHIVEARPTVTFNYISRSADAAMSANPDSFNDALGRIGPDIQGNFLDSNAIDGLFIRIETEFGSRVEKLTVPGRFDDADITHVITENLQIDGQPGGPIIQAGQRVARSAGRLLVDPGVVLKFNDSRIEAERGSSSLIAEGTPNRPIIFTSIRDDRFGGSGSFDTNRNGFSLGQAGDWSGIVLNHTSSASIDHAVITFGGGDSPIEGDSVNFNAIEVHQAHLRLTNSLLQNNASGNAAGTREGRGNNQAATIFVRGSQPVIVNNVFEGNGGPTVNINANSLRSENMRDPGRSTGSVDVFSQFAQNHGPLVRLNRLNGNGTNAMLVRGEELTTQSIWDDTDIVHVLSGEIVVGNHHTYSGLRLQSSRTESLVVKAGSGAGLTATGAPLDIPDRIGGTIQVLGTVGHPVVLTHLADDSVGAGLTPEGKIMLDTNGNGPSAGASGGWRGLLFDEFSNDRNVAIVRESERALTDGNDVNRTPTTSQLLGTLAPDEKSGDENRRLGFEVKGFISPNDSDDVDIYSFRGTAGTEVWLDVDRTDPTLDLIIEVMNANGTVVARSVAVNSPDNLNDLPLQKELLKGGDFYTQNFRDPGFRYVLPGTSGTLGTYYVRVRSNPASSASVATIAGESRGEYQLQIRQRQEDEFPGSTVRYADIRFAQTGIDIRGLPAHSPLIAEAGELETSAGQNDSPGQAERLVNLLQTDMAAMGLSGQLHAQTDVDWYQFNLDHSDIQFIPGVNDGAGTVSLVFDLDYADGAVRGDTTLAVYDSNQKLIFVGRESNVEDDQPNTATSGADVNDLSRGSLGTKDPFIGPVHFTVGYDGLGSERLTYYVAVMSNRSVPTQAAQTLLAYPVTNSATPVDPRDRMAQLTRLEPINSLERVVEDHIGFQGYRSNGAQINPQVDEGIFNISNKLELDNHVRPFMLRDVVLYTATDPSGDNGDNLYTANPFAGGGYLTRVNQNLSGGDSDIRDIVMRSDGRMFGFQRLDNNAGQVGALVEINPSTGAVTLVSNANIPDRSPTPNIASFGTNIPNRVEQWTTSDEVDALTFERRGTTGSSDAPVPQYDLYYVVRESDNSSKLYRARSNGDATPAPASGGNQRYGVLGDIQPAGVSHASTTFSVFDNANPANRTDIRIEAKQPGAPGDAITLNITRPNNNNAVVSVSGNTINLQIGGTGGPPTTNGPSAAAIVNAINNNADARALVTAVIVGGNGGGGNGSDGTAAASVATGNIPLTGGTPPAAPDAPVPLSGRVTGISFGNYSSSGNLFAVTSAGELLVVNKDSGLVTKRLDVAGAFGSSISFQGLALGPQNVEGGDYKTTLFAITSNGTLYAFDSTQVAGVDETDPTEVELLFRPVFNAGGQTAQVTGMGSSVIGLAFSPLDFNLWHPTARRAFDAGHGINSASDDSRVPSSVNRLVPDPGPGAGRNFSEQQGGVSFHFGFERYEDIANSGSQTYLTYESGQRTQLGILNEEQQKDLSSNDAIRGTYNLPGGALGSLASSEFSLAGYDRDDVPTLYFNYFLETEDHGGSTTSSDGSNPFRDSARVFASRNGGLTWELLATNNSQLSAGSATGVDAELPGFLSHLSDAGRNSTSPRADRHQLVQELFDNTGQWRQARIDLSTFVGESDIRLRFDFSTAGTMNDPALDSTDDNFGEFSDGSRSIRSLDNQHEGFYVDDIVVGFAERGEMVTGPNTAPITSATDLFAGGARTSRDNDPNANPSILSGRYQLEVRRAGEYAGLLDAGGVRVGAIYDTNDRHIIESTETANIDFESGGVPAILTTPSSVTVGGTNYSSFNIKPWQISNNAFDGALAFESSDVGGGEAAVFQATLSDLTGGNTAAGNIRFAYSVSSEADSDGLRFLIDGVEQRIREAPGEVTSGNFDLTFASGDVPYQVVQLPFGEGEHTFTWVYQKDGAGTEGLDQAFLDNLIILQGGTGLSGDRNRERPQGVFIVESNFIRDSSIRGINVQAGPAQAGGNLPHPGSTINFPQTDQSRLVPGVVIQNNVVANSSGVRFAGAGSANPQTPVPFGKIVNNTFVGDNGGLGVDVDALASPTIMNNVFAFLGTAIDDGGVSTEIRSNFFQQNGNNGSVGTAAIVVTGSPDLFVDAANGNYYLAATSQAIDSSLNTLQDRFNYANFKNALGIPPSPLFAPDRDVYGQVRVDSGGSSGGGGSTVVKDRGAIDRSDSDAPFAELIVPVDNDIEGNDSDPNRTIVWQKNPFLESISILLSDGPGPNSPFQGTGVDGLTVDDPSVPSISMDAIEITQNGQPLTEGVDYELGYNSLTGVLSLTPLATLWQPQSVYEITLDNTLITDLAGNALRSNQPDGSTRFTILLGDFDFDYGDAPDSFGTLLASNGARHILTEPRDVILGRLIDAEQGIVAASDDATPTLAITESGDSFTVAINSPATLATVTVEEADVTAGDTLTFTFGSEITVFELSLDGTVTTAGATAIEFTSGDSAASIAATLAAAISNVLGDAGLAEVSAAQPEQVKIDVNDDDGVPVGAFDSGSSIATGLILEPGTGPVTSDPNDVVGFLNPRDQDFGTLFSIDVTGSGLLDAWVDFNGNGIFTDPGEQILDNYPVVDGLNGIPVFAPSGTSNGLKHARFRVSTAGVLEPTGLALDGEVEDYQLLVANVNLPVPQNQDYGIDEDVFLTSEFLPAPTIPLAPTVDAATLRYEILDGPDFGTHVLLNAETGEFSYDPNEDFFGTDTFTYRVVGTATIDGQILPVRSTAIATATITVAPVNDSPTAEAHAFQTVEPSDTSGPTAVTISDAQLLQNALVQDDTDLRDAPWDEKEQLLKVVQISVRDAAGNLVPVLTELDESPLLDPFMPVDGVFTADTHIDGAVTGSVSVTVVGNAVTEVVYQPSEHYNEDNPRSGGLPSLDGFQYTVADDGKATLPNGDPADPQPAPLFVDASVTIQVYPSNDAPVAVDDAIPGADWTGANPTEDTTLVIPRAFLLANDSVAAVGADDELNGIDDNDGAKFVVTDSTILGTLVPGLAFPLTTEQGGTVALNGDGELEYTPAADYYGPDSFTYWVGDEGIDEDVTGARTSQPKYAEATVSLIVDPVNDAPLAINHSHVILEEDFLTLTADDLLAGDTLDLLFGAQAHHDPQIGDAPWDETNQRLRVISLNIDGITVDASNAASSPFSTPYGNIVVNFAGTTAGDALVDLTYIPNQHFNVDNPLTSDGIGGLLRTLETFSYTISDDGLAILPQDPDEPPTPVSQPEKTATATVTIAVKPQNDAPIANDDQISLGVAGSADWQNFFAPDAALAPTEDITLVIPSAFLLDNDFVGPVGADDELEAVNSGGFDAANDNAKFVVTDPAILDSLQAGLSFPLTTTEGGTVVVNADGDLEYTPARDYYGPDSFTYWVGDEGVDEAVDGTRTNAPRYAQATVSLIVEPVNDAPSTIDHSRIILEDGSLTVTAAELLVGAAEHFDPQIEASPWDETNQTLRVISLNVNGTIVDASNAALGPFATPYGSVEATFDGDQAGDALISLLYTPNEHFNVDNPLTDDAGTLIRSLESLTYTISDDGFAVLPQNDPGDPPVQQPELTATATLTIETKPQNDAPVVGGDEISVGLPGSTRWEDYFANLPIPQPAIAPTEDTTLVIPVDFLLGNDAVGPVDAGDELGAVNGNDGTKFLVTNSGILVTLDPGLSYPLTTAQGGTVDIDPLTGDLIYSPATDFYGLDTFTYWVGDQGFDEAVDGTRTANPLYTETTVTLIVQPVNDDPSADNHEYIILEDEPITLTAADLLAGAAEHLDPMFPNAQDPEHPWDETNQDLRVVRLEIAGVVIDQSGNFATPHGTVDATFASTPAGLGLVDLTFTPAPHFNADNPRTGGIRTLETFTYTIADDGLAVLPQDPSAPPIAQAQLTATAMFSIEVKPQNDTPIANDEAIPGLAWSGPNPTEDVTLLIPPSFLLANDAVGPVGTNDEINGVNGNDGQRFLVTDQAILDSFGNGYSFPLTTAQGGQVVFNDQTGFLQYTPRADYYGPDSFTYWVGDRGINEDVNGVRTVAPKYAQALVSLVVDPVNDAPAANDHHHVILEDGSLTLTADDMLSGDLNLLTGAVEHNDPQIGTAPWDERNQNLRVTAITVNGTAITGDNASAGPFAMSHGILDVVFNGDALESLTYTPNQDFNVDNPLTDDTLAGLIRTLESFTYTVSDDGLAVLPQDPGGVPVAQPEEVAVGTVTIEVKPQNDTPIARDNAIPSPEWFAFDATAPRPTEDTTLVIPTAFLLSNDAVGPQPTNDELGGVNDNDGELFLVTDATVLETLAAGASFPLTTQRGGQVVFNPVTGDIEYAPPADYFGPDSFTYWVGDRGIDENVDGIRIENRRYAQATVSLIVDPVNDAPGAQDHHRVILEDRSITLRASELMLGAVEHADPQRPNFPWDEDNQSLRIVSINAGGVEVTAANANDGPFQTQHGSVTVQFNGDALDRVIYTPNQDFNEDNPLQGTTPALDFFTYTVADDGRAILPQDLGGPVVQQPQETVTATVTLEVKPQNDAPLALGDAIPGANWSLGDPQEDQTLVIPPAFLLQNDVVAPLTANDELPPTSVNDGAAFLVTNNALLNSFGTGNAFPMTTAQGGRVQWNPVTGSLEYTPAANFFGMDSFTYWMGDVGVNEAIDGTRTEASRYARATVSLMVASVNDPPQFNGAPSVTVLEDAGETNPSVPAGDVGLSTFPNWVTNIQPGPNGATDELDSQTVEFIVEPIDANQAAAARGLFQVDTGDNLLVAVDENGTLQFRTLADANGSAVFSVVALDSNGAESVPRTFTISVTAVNDPPTFDAGPLVSVDEDDPAYSEVWATNILPGPIDEQNEPQTVSRFEVETPANKRDLFSELPAIDPSGVLTFTPAPNAWGTVTISVRAVDSLGLASDPVNLTIDIASQTDVPTAGDDVGSVDEDNPVVLTRTLLLSNDADADLPFDTLTLILGSQTSIQGAAISINADGDVLYDPSGAADLQALQAGEELTDSFTYRLEDSTGQLSEVATVVLTVSGLNDAPRVQDDQFEVRFTGSTTIQPLANDVDVDGEIAPATLVITTQPTFGSVSVQDDGTIVYTPSGDFTGSDTIEYTVADDFGQASRQATIAITVDGDNDPANFIGVNGVAGADSLTFTESKQTPQQFSYDLNTWFSDPEGDALTFEVISDDPSVAAVQLTGSQLQLTLPSYGFGTANLTVVARNVPPSATTTTSVVIPVQANDTPDAPRVVGTLDPLSGTEDVTVIADLSSVFSDPDRTALTYRVISPTSFANSPLVSGITFVGDEMRIALRPDANGSTDITIGASDGTSEVTEAFTLNVAPADDSPVGGDDFYDVAIGARLSVLDPTQGVLQNDVDPDGGTFQLELVDAPSKGTLDLRNDGTFIYQNQSGEIGQTDTFTYRLLDAAGNSAPVTVTLTLAGSAYQNPATGMRLDVTGDGFIGPDDALQVINLLNRLGNAIPVSSLTTPPPPYADVDGNGLIEPFDALQVINELNLLNRQRNAAQGESVDTRVASAASFAAMDAFARDEAPPEQLVVSEADSQTAWQAEFAAVDNRIDAAVAGLVSGLESPSDAQQQAATDSALLEWFNGINPEISP